MKPDLRKATPRPWRWFTNYHCPGKLKGAYIDAQGEIPARVADVLSHGGVGSQEACEANAALIVEAVSSFDTAQKLAEAVLAIAELIASGARNYDPRRTPTRPEWEAIVALARKFQIQEVGDANL